MKNIEMTAVFEPCKEGGFIAYVQEIQGINTQGETIEEAKENLADAVNLVFEEMRATVRKGITKKMITQTMSFSFWWKETSWSNTSKRTAAPLSVKGAAIHFTEISKMARRQPFPDTPISRRTYAVRYAKTLVFQIF
jgi:predicted RNase H-like HicB family nuclease